MPHQSSSQLPIINLHLYFPFPLHPQNILSPENFACHISSLMYTRESSTGWVNDCSATLPSAVVSLCNRAGLHNTPLEPNYSRCWIPAISCHFTQESNILALSPPATVHLNPTPSRKLESKNKGMLPTQKQSCRSLQQGPTLPLRACLHVVSPFGWSPWTQLSPSIRKLVKAARGLQL